MADSIHKKVIQELLGFLQHEIKWREEDIYKDQCSLLNIELRQKYSIGNSGTEGNSFQKKFDTEYNSKKSRIDSLKVEINEYEEKIHMIELDFPAFDSGTGSSEVFTKIDEEWLQKYSL
jgi:hypothetical protein